ncbi:hypothetical protein PPERSA_09052 [Pseudocohnilembus persalinus]|uniref:EF-hand domain-containing protein n=1 Tax=Pseudocohnilembus persalinus TaxID=266149 RepID=A0A0V0QL26_PSEPJ|nr:hypothetical protein PPERSA_09052 [Pseudocohnilembus persalinus]|eukprot:KRX02930.1 hypothetical protein PPERSA_09052 [Pseudocohnilembus persalinus]
MEYQLYINTLKYFYLESQAKIQSVIQFSDTFIEYDNIKPYLLLFYEPKLNNDEFQKLQFEIKGLCENEVSQKNSMEFGELFKICLHHYKRKKNEVQRHIQDIFYATDLDGNDSIELYEFQMICKYIEKMPFEQSEKLFIEEADFTNSQNQERALSFEKFTQLALEKGLFQYKKTEIFSQQVPKDDQIVTGYIQLQRHWQERKSQIKYRFLKSKQYKDNIAQMLDQIEQKLELSELENSKSVWLSYRLLDEESRRLVLEFESNKLISEILPIKLHMLNFVAQKFNQLEI